MPNRKIEQGQRFGRLTTLRVVGRNSKGSIWLCKCDCGNETRVNAYNLGRVTNSCGCLFRERMKDIHTTHGKTNSRLFNIWVGMRHRCRNTSLPEYPYYGGRGIAVCTEWDESFEAFEKWANKSGYNDSLTLDRIDVDGNYEPSNCRWITIAKQQSNKRNNVFLSHNGETHTVMEWSRIVNISYKALIQRVHMGWDTERILTTPVRVRKRRAL